MLRNRNIDLKKSVFFTVKTVALLLIICFIVEGPLNLFGRVSAAERVYYVSEIKAFQAKTEQEARKACEAEGYECSNRDVNAGTDEDAVILGYKLTENRDEALYDISLLQMNDGYQIKDYAQANAELEKSNMGAAETLYESANEFIVNYEADSPKAKTAYEGLNLISIPEENDMKLGDFIVQGKADVNFFAKVFTRASTGTINTITNYLAAGLTPLEKTTEEETGEEVDVTWASIVKDSALWEVIESQDTPQDQLDEYDKEMGDDAQAFFKQLQLFATGYENGEASYDEQALAQEMKNANVDEIVENAGQTTDEDNAVAYVNAYETLNRYEAFSGMPLGEYLVDIGKQTSDAVDIRRLYPVIESMSMAQRRMVGMSGLMSLISNLGKNEVTQETQELMDTSKEKISELTGQESFSIWLNTDPDMANKKVAITSDAIRIDAATKLLNDQANDDWAEEKKTINDVIKWAGIGSASVTALTFLTGAKGIVGGIAFALKSATSVLAVTVSSVCSKIMAIAAAISSVTNVISLFVLAFTVVFLIYSMIKDYIEKHKAQEYTDMPDYVIDARTVNGSDISVKYKAVMDNNGKIADLNAYKAHDGWVCIYTSSDSRIGSPIRADENGDVFNIVYGNPNKLSGYDCASYFGQVTPGNCNMGAEDDDVDGIYINYFTENSLKNRSSAADPESGVQSSGAQSDGKKEYIKDMVVMSGKTAALAKSKITKKGSVEEGGFEIFDQNLSPDVRTEWYDEGQFTYIGYKTTTDPKKAVRDIRVVNNISSEGAVKFGEISYACAGMIGFPANNKDENEDYPSELDGLFYTTNENAGSPIEVGKLHLVSDHAKAEAGWEPVTTFGGVPYNFNTTHTIATGTAGYCAYPNLSEGKWGENIKSYLYYEPEVKYTEGTKYLAGVFFGFAADTQSSETTPGVRESKAEDLFTTLSALPNTVEADAVKGVNLAQSYSYKGYPGDSEQKYMHMYYVWSYNPYRALTDVQAYRGEPYLSSLPFTIDKALTYPPKSASTAQTTVSYAAASVVVQRVDSNGYAFRTINPANTYMAPEGVLELISAMKGNDLTVDMGYTRDVQGGFTTGGERMTLLPTNLYLSGYVKDRSRLTLDDVVITQGQHEGTQNSGKYTFDVSGEKTLGGSAAEGDFCSIQDLKEPYSLTAFNISYPTWYFASAGEVSSMATRNDDRSSVEQEMRHDACPAVYMYVRHDVVKKRYISRVFVGASTRDNADSTDKNVLKSYDKQVDLSAMIAATAAGSDEVIPYNIAGDPAKAWNNSVLNTDKLMEKPTPPDGGDPAAYISVARTDDPDKAIRSIVLYQSNENAVPEEIKVDRAVYYCASNTKPIRMNDNKKYYIYYSYNIGAAPGKPITELDVSEDVFYTGCSTALVVDKPDTTEIKNGKLETVERSKPYGNTELQSFIHAKYVADSVYFNKIFTASGSTVKEAQLGLLEQGCTEFCNIDLNKGAGGKYVFFGYRGFSLDEDKINENATEEAREKARDSQLSEAIYDIVCTVGEPFRPNGFLSDRYQIYYAPVAKKDKNGNITGTNLNEGTTGPEIYLYYTNMDVANSYNERAAKESLTLSTMPKDYLLSPLTKIGFALYDYVPYSKEIEAASSGSEEMTPWEYVMKSDNKAPANLNEGAVLFDSDHMMSDNRLTMFAQRADGNVKPSAEITGGYNTALVAESKLYNYK